MNYLKNQRGVALILELILVSLVLAAVGVSVYAAMQHKTSSSVATKTTPTPSKSPSSTSTPDPYAGWKLYTSSSEGLSFKYPTDWSVKNIAGGIVLTSPHYLAVSQPSGPSLNMYYEVTYSDQNLENASIGGKVIAVSPLKIKGSAASYYLNTFSYNGGASSASVSGLYLTDKTPTVNQNQPYMTFSSKDNASTQRTMSASLLPPNAQNNGGESLASYTNHPDYQTILKIFSSLSY